MAASTGQMLLCLRCGGVYRRSRSVLSLFVSFQIHRNILADEAVAELVKSGVEAAIFVQCLNRCMDEVRWVEKLAEKHTVIKGIVGGLDLTQEPEELRKQLRSTPLLVGVRHILDCEEEDWLTREDVHRGLQVVMEEGKVFDCLVRPPILKHVAPLGGWWWIVS